MELTEQERKDYEICIYCGKFKRDCECKGGGKDTS